jgi:uncharacterized protein YjbI with pentapeptide repeats
MDRQWRPPFRPLSSWAIMVMLALGIGAAYAIGKFLWDGVDVATLPPAQQAPLTIEVVKTALTAGISAGGLLALFVSFRRQWLSERDSILQDRVAASNLHDATEKRVTELYGKAVDQLANNSAAARLAALYSLERLAQANEEHRQTIVDLICGYMRIKKEPSVLSASADGNRQSVLEHEEAEVRATAQKILQAHLRIPYDRIGYVGYLDHFWEYINLDLHGARLENFSLEDCMVDDVDLRGAEFLGRTIFTRARFVGEANFEGATFRGPVDIYDARGLMTTNFPKTVKTTTSTRSSS